MAKSPEAFRTISEVADLLEVPAHVLRFWETRFPQIRPVKRAGGRRYYRPTDVALLSGIRILLHDQGMTIRGVQKILREQGVRHVCALADPGLETEAQEEWTQEATVSAPLPVEDRVIPWPGPRRAPDDADAPQAGTWPDSAAPEVSEASDLLPDPQATGTGESGSDTTSPDPVGGDDLSPDLTVTAVNSAQPESGSSGALADGGPSWRPAPPEEPPVTSDLMPDPHDDGFAVTAGAQIPAPQAPETPGQTTDGSPDLADLISSGQWPPSAPDEPLVTDDLLPDPQDGTPVEVAPKESMQGSAAALPPAPSDDAPWPEAPPQDPPVVTDWPPDPQDRQQPAEDALASPAPDVDEAPSEQPVALSGLRPDPHEAPAPVKARPDPLDGLPLFMQPAPKPISPLRLPDLPEDLRHDIRALAARLGRVSRGDIDPTVLRDLVAKLHGLRARMDQSHPER